MVDARSWLAGRFGALGDVFQNPQLRRLELAWGGFYAGEWAHVVALAVFAYDSGGASAVGLVGFIRMMPAALTVPFAAVLADRYPRERVLLAVHVLRAAAIGAAAAALFGDGPEAAVYGLAACAAISATAFRPSHWALLPVLARTPRELVAANVSSSTIESLAIVVGPAAAGVLLIATGPDVVFAASAAAALWSALLVARIDVPSGVERKEPTRQASLWDEAFAGFRSLRAQPGPRLLIGLFGAQTLVRGLLNVLIVVAALELLELGESGVGFLNSAFGAGGLVGALGALALVDRRRLARPFGLSLVLWGLPIALIGLWPKPFIALLCLAVVGAGNSVLDVSGLTLVQRSVTDTVLARVFGVLEVLAVGAVGVGAILTPVLVSGLGIEGSLVATGALLPLLALLFARRLERIDDAVAPRDRDVALLRNVAIFAPLPPAMVEQLASRLVKVSVPAGTEVIRQGDPGDRFYIVGSGELTATESGIEVNVLGPGDSFGEIALLRDVPRTATVTATSDALLYALERDVFVSAVSGHAQSSETADAVISARLGGMRAPSAPL